MKSVLLLLALIPLALASLTFQVEPKTVDCFYVDLQPGQKLKIPFYVIRGGLLDIELRVRDFSADLYDQLYHLCF